MAKLTKEEADRLKAIKHISSMLGALEEHLGEAERNDNPLMAGIYQTFLSALNNAGRVAKDGSLTITLKPNSYMSEGK